MFAISYDFDCLEIEIDGIRVGWFAGTAVLEEDGSDFYVSRISLQGEKVENRPGSLIFKKRTTHMVPLPKPAFDDDDTFEQKLYGRIEEALYASDHAREWFAEQLVMEFAA